MIVRVSVVLKSIVAVTLTTVSDGNVNGSHDKIQLENLSLRITRLFGYR